MSIDRETVRPLFREALLNRSPAFRGQAPGYQNALVEEAVSSLMREPLVAFNRSAFIDAIDREIEAIVTALGPPKPPPAPPDPLALAWAEHDREFATP